MASLTFPLVTQSTLPVVQSSPTQLPAPVAEKTNMSQFIEDLGGGKLHCRLSEAFTNQYDVLTYFQEEEETVARGEKVTRLTITTKKVDAAMLAIFLPLFSNLEKLSLDISWGGNESLKMVLACIQLPSFKFLKLNNIRNVGAEILSAVSSFIKASPQLTDLDISQMFINAHQVETMLNYRPNMNLSVALFNPTHEDIEKLRKFGGRLNITGLCFKNEVSGIVDTLTEPICEDIEELILSDTNLSNVDTLEDIGESLDKVTSFMIGGTNPLSISNLKKILRKLPNLTDFHVIRWKSMHNHSRLYRLLMRSAELLPKVTKLTLKGVKLELDVREILQRSFPHLKNLYIEGESLTDEVTLEEFRTSFPNCKLDGSIRNRPKKIDPTNRRVIAKVLGQDLPSDRSSSSWAPRRVLKPKLQNNLPQEMMATTELPRNSENCS